MGIRLAYKLLERNQANLLERDTLITGWFMSILNLKRLLVLLCVATMGVAAFVAPMPQGDLNWGNTVVAGASIGYLISLFLIALDFAVARYLFLPSILISLLGMPVASYPYFNNSWSSIC